MKVASFAFAAILVVALPAQAREALIAPVNPATLAREAPPSFDPAAAPIVDLVTPMGSEELDEVRGGFLVAGELAFEFGAVVRTFKDGALALQTEVNWSQAGPVVTRLTDDAMIGLAGGASQVLQRVENGQLTNILLNTESNRSFRQETDITLTLPGFAATQLNIGGTLAAQRLNDDLSVGAIGALR